MSLKNLTDRWLVRSGGPLACCIFLLFAATPGHSYQLSGTEVQKAVETWVNLTVDSGQARIAIEKMYPYMEENSIVAYVALLKNKGFCLCAADTRLLPVYLYNPKGVYDSTDEENRLVLQHIGERGRTDNANGTVLDVTELAWREQYWADLINGVKPSSRPSVSAKMMFTPSAAPASAGSETMPDHIILPLTSKWHQGDPYNWKCPRHFWSNERTAAGCNAIAATQLMNYWKWPPTGTGTVTGSYESRWSGTWLETPLATNPNIPAGWNGFLRWTNPGGAGTLGMTGAWDGSRLGGAQNGIAKNDAAFQAALIILWNQLTVHTENLSVNYASYTYAWNAYLDINTPTDTAVGSLVASQGVTQGYGVSGTGGSFGGSRTLLVNNLLYGSDAVFIAPQKPRSPTMESEMMEEIRWLRPMGLGGSGNGGGHAYVIWGYDTRTGINQFLCNFGWGSGNNDSTWYTLDNTQFPDNQDRLAKLAPNTGVYFVTWSGADGSGTGSPNSPYGNLTTAMSGAPANSTLILKGGSTHILADGYTLTKEMVLKGDEVVITGQE
jgi:hypothetical protein